MWATCNLLFFSSHFIIFFIFLTFIHFWETETECERRGGRKKRETQNLKQAPGSKLSAQSPTTWGSELVPWDHDLNQSYTLNQLRHPGTPVVVTLKWAKETGKINFKSMFPLFNIFKILLFQHIIGKKVNVAFYIFMFKNVPQISRMFFAFTAHLSLD